MIDEEWTVVIESRERPGQCRKITIWAPTFWEAQQRAMKGWGREWKLWGWDDDFLSPDEPEEVG